MYTLTGSEVVVCMCMCAYGYSHMREGTEAGQGSRLGQNQCQIIPATGYLN